MSETCVNDFCLCIYLCCWNCFHSLVIILNSLVKFQVFTFCNFHKIYLMNEKDQIFGKFFSNGTKQMKCVCYMLQFFFIKPKQFDKNLNNYYLKKKIELNICMLEIYLTQVANFVFRVSSKYKKINHNI